MYRHGENLHKHHKSQMHAELVILKLTIASDWRKEHHNQVQCLANAREQEKIQGRSKPDRAEQGRRVERRREGGSSKESWVEGGAI